MHNMVINPSHGVIGWVHGIICHYNHKKYWKYRAEVVNPHSRKPKWLRLLYLFYIKRCDAFNNASMGTDLGQGASFASPPHLPHHLNGIIIGHDAKIGRDCVIFQRVTIVSGGGGTNVFPLETIVC